MTEQTYKNAAHTQHHLELLEILCNFFTTHSMHYSPKGKIHYHLARRKFVCFAVCS